MRATPLDWIQRWFLRAGLFVLPLGFAWDTVDQYVLPKLLIARVVLLGLLLLFVARSALSGRVTVRRTPLDLPLLAFVVSAAVSTLFAANQNVAIFGTYFRYEGLLTLITYVAVFWLSVQMLSGADEARGLLRVVLVSAYPVAVIAILQSVSDSLRLGSTAAAFGTMGNPNVLGAFLAMAFALALSELVEAKEATGRVLIGNLLVVVGLALLLSLSRSGWLGAALGAAIVAAGARRAARRLGVALAVAALVAVVLVVVALAGRGLGVEFKMERDVGTRVLTLVDPNQWGTSRLHIWQDSLTLIASRPVAGYGPDNFGLVFPRFATGDWGVTNTGFHQQIDKAHLETLQVAATQGVLGLAAYLWILFAFARSFWPWRHLRSAVGVFAAFVAYQATIQLNFTSLASAFPFWILVAAGMVTFGALRPPRVVALPWRAPLLAGSSFVVAVVAVLVVPLIIYPYVADAQLRQAIDLVSRGRPGEAQAAAELATSFAPQESVYAVEVANIAVERHDLNAARAAYIQATRLGTYNAFVYMNLAVVDLQLGRRAEALSAARTAVALNRFDPATQALVAQIEAASP